MAKLKILNKKEIKHISSIIDKQFSTKLPDKVFLLSEKERLYMINRDFSIIDDKEIKIDSIGLYVGTIKGNTFRLSIEGSQLIKAKKGIIELDDEQLQLWIRGNDLEIDKNLSGPLIVKNKYDFFGCGIAKEGKLINHVPKERRISNSS